MSSTNLYHDLIQQYRAIGQTHVIFANYLKRGFIDIVGQVQQFKKAQKKLNRMSYKAELELSVHLHSFKNVQIDRQGYAAIRIQIVDESAPNSNYALPYNIVNYHKVGLVSIAAQPTIEDTAFHTSTVKIQYADQRYYLNDIVQFKLLIQSVPKLQSNKIYIKFHLLFSTLHSYNHNLDPSIHLMQTITFKLQNIESGILNYYEGQFTQNYASQFSFTIFSMITDFKLFPYSMRKEVISESQQERKREKQREKVSEIQDLFIWSSKYIKNCKEPIQYYYNNFARVLRYNSYLLRTKFNQHIKNPKQTQLKLPKFFKQNQIVTGKQFYDFFSNFDPSKLTIKNYQQQIYELHQENYFFAQEVAQAMSKGFLDNKKLQNEYKNYKFSLNEGRIVRQVKYGQKLVNTSHAYENIAIANKIRKQRKQEEPYPIMPFEEKVEQYLFYQICYSKQLIDKQVSKLTNQLPYSYDERNMLIFLCHGFQASSYDMRIVHRGIKEALPLAEIVVSCVNEIDTDADIDSMGRKLAHEIQNKIKVEGLKKEQIILNFVGHSMGGIIARASLKYLPDFQNQLGFFCSLSSPHLGYLNGTDNMIKAGFWVMRKMLKQPKSLEQLSMADSTSLQNTFLYNLSKQGSLRKFKKIILISSAEDSYVPWHSARICGYDAKRSTSKLEQQMAANILGDLTVHRVDVNFACEKGDLDGFIGRKAHINLIINESIFKLVNAVIPNLFDLKSI